MEERECDASSAQERRPWRSKSARSPASTLAAAPAVASDNVSSLHHPTRDGPGDGGGITTNGFATRTVETYRLLCSALASHDVATVTSFVTECCSATGSTESLRSVRRVAQQLSNEDVWGVLRLVLNQLTTADVDHKSGRADFRVVEAVYPIRTRLAVQQRLVTYCVTFPLPTTGQQASAQRFVTVFTDSIVTFGCDMSFVFHLLLRLMFLHRKCAPWEEWEAGVSPLGAEDVTVPSYLRALTPDLPWHTVEPVSREVRERWRPFLGLARDAQFPCPATHTSRIAWIMMGELAAHGYMPAAVLVQSLARHPEVGVHVLPDVWRQVVHTIAMVHAPESRRVPWPLLHEMLEAADVEGEPDAEREQDECGEGPAIDVADDGPSAAAYAASFTHALADAPQAACAAAAAEGSLPVPLLVFEDVREDDDSEFVPLTNPFGFALRLRSVHRDILHALKQYDTRMAVYVEAKAFNALNQRGTTAATPSVRNVVNCWTPSCPKTDVVFVHDYLLLCLLRRLRLPAVLCSYLVENFVARPPLSTFTSALVLKYAINCRAMERQLQHLLE